MKHLYIVETSNGFKSEVAAHSKRGAIKEFKEKNGWILRALNIKPKFTAYKEV